MSLMLMTRIHAKQTFPAVINTLHLSLMMCGSPKAMTDKSKYILRCLFQI